MIYSKEAIDYEAGFDICNPETNETYTEEQARQLPKEIQSKLTMRPRKMGAWVMTAEESAKITEERYGCSQN